MELKKLEPWLNEENIGKLLENVSEKDITADVYRTSSIIHFN